LQVQPSISNDINCGDGNRLQHPIIYILWNIFNIFFCTENYEKFKNIHL